MAESMEEKLKSNIDIYIKSPLEEKVFPKKKCCDLGVSHGQTDGQSQRGSAGGPIKGPTGNI